MLSELRPALVLTLLMTVLTGLAYPLAITGVAQAVFPGRANGSLIQSGEQVIGSALIAQGFAKPEYFHPRPSAAGNGYEADKSSGGNLSPGSSKLVEAVKERTEAMRADVGERRVPIDSVTSSGSGLDPHISPRGALAQAGRVARARGIAEGDVTQLVNSHIEARTFGILGEARVNVLRLNMALDALPKASASQ